MINNLDDNPENVCLALASELDDDEKGDIKIEMFEDSENIPDPKSFDVSDKNLIIFDDIMCDKDQTPAGKFYTRARHNNIDCIYISQNFYQLPRRSIRSNANFIVLFELSETDINHIFRDLNASTTFKDINAFREFCNKSWNKPYGYVVLDITNKDIKNRYRNQLELVKEEPKSCLKDPEELVTFEKHVTFEDEQQPLIQKQRATKKCEQCNMQILSSSFARHLKSKQHNKKTSK